MTTGALTLQTPRDLFAKLAHEMASWRADLGNTYAALNAVRDAYHLREWIWHAHLEHDSASQILVMGGPGEEGDWNQWVNLKFPHFKALKDLTNGSKHFEDKNTFIVGAENVGWDTAIWDADCWDDRFRIRLLDGSAISLSALLIGVEKFWRDVMQRNGWL